MTDTGKGQVGVPLSATRLSQWDIESKPGTDLEPGTRIKQYELIRELGRGGMGVVYVARDLVLGRRVAMKFLRNVDREIIDRFLVEARATAQCNHDNIVIIYEVDEWQGMPYMVLEFLEGRSLRELIGTFNDGQPMPGSRGSSARPRCWRRSTTRTSPPSTVSSPSPTPGSWSWSWSRAIRWRTSSSAALSR